MRMGNPGSMVMEDGIVMTGSGFTRIFLVVVSAQPLLLVAMAVMGKVPTV